MPLNLIRFVSVIYALAAVLLHLLVFKKLLGQHLLILSVISTAEVFVFAQFVQVS